MIDELFFKTNVQRENLIADYYDKKTEESWQKFVNNWRAYLQENGLTEEEWEKELGQRLDKKLKELGVKL